MEDCEGSFVKGMCYAVPLSITLWMSAIGWIKYFIYL